MDKDYVKALIRGLLTSTTDIYNIRRLQRDFKEDEGCELPTFGYRNVAEFLRSIPDTVRVVGEYPNEQLHLVKSEKSLHVADLVDNQNKSSKRRRGPRRRNGHGRSDFRRDTRRDTRPPRPRQSSYGHSSYSSSNVPPRFQNSYSSRPSEPRAASTSSAVFVSPYDRIRLHDFLKKFPNGATFEEVTRHMLDPNEKWSKYYIQDGVPELVKYCQNFCTIHANRVFTNEHYEDFMRRTKVDVPKNGYMPAGNESDYSSDEFFDDYDDDEEEYVQNHVPTQQYSNKCQLPKQCDIQTFKIRLKEIVEKYKNGIYCSELFDIYEKYYNEELEFSDYGYHSLIDLLNDMPDIVRCSKADNKDWKIYGVEEKSREEDVLSDASSDSISHIKSNLLTLFRSKNGILESDIPMLYYKMFNERLDYRELGYENFQSFINSLENKIFCRLKGSHSTLLFPVEEISKINRSVSNHSSSQKISQKSLYPEEVLGPNESIPKIDLRNYVTVGEYIEVCPLEIWNPSKFFLQLRQFKADLWDLMENLQIFYNKIKDHYRMPEETLVPDQICAALYDLDGESEWHRAMIVKIIDEERILVNLIDYGTSTKINKNRLRFLNREFATLPCQAIMARLANTEPKKGLLKWPQEASKRFFELIFQKDLVAGVVEMDHKKCWMSVALSFTEGTEIHISDTLVEEGLARFTDVILGEAPKEQAGPKKAMKNKDIFVLEDEPEDISEVINSSNESNNSKQETTFSNTPLPNQNAASALNSETLASATTLLNSLSNPLASVPLISNPLNTENVLNYGFDSTSLLLNQMAGLSLNSALQTSLTSKTPPPGFSNLPQIDPEEDLKNKINMLALQIYTNQPEIRIIAFKNPELGLKIAMTIAEDYLRPKNQNSQVQVPQSIPEPQQTNFSISDSQFHSFLTAKAESLSQKLEAMSKPVGTAPNVARVIPSVKTDVSQAATTAKKTEIVTGVPRRKIQVLPFEESKESCPSFPEKSEIDDKESITLEKKNSVIIKESRLLNKPIHIIKVNKELFVLLEEVIKNFTPFSSKKIADQIVTAKKCSFKYRNVSAFSDPEIYETINKATISKFADNENEYTILPLKSILKYLRTLTNIDEGSLATIVRFIESYKDETCA